MNTTIPGNRAVEAGPADQSGFTLIEVLVACAIFITGITALASLFVLSIDANRLARETTFSMVLAQQKMEQLRGLQWGFDVLGVPLSDTTADTSVVPFTNAGTGLSPSPAGSLQQNITGCVDYLDGRGAWIGSGAAVPRGAAYLRRWSIEPLPSDPQNTVILHVLVRPVRLSGLPPGGSAVRLPGEARLLGLKTRKAP
jgi:prepilin-type N-terminal cleavage/methylation domain-containing protein